MDHSYGHSYDDVHSWDDTDGAGAGEWRRRKANTKRKRKQHVTAAVAPPPALDLTLRGTACRVTQDDALAENIEQGLHLINYFEDRFIILSDDEESDDGCIEGGDMAMSTCANSTLANADETNGQITRNHTDNRTRVRTLYMDRYDARMLIDDYSTLRRRGSRRTWSSHNLADCDVADITLLELIGVRDAEDGLSKQQIDGINFDRFGALPEYRDVFLDDGKNDCIKSGGVDQEDADKVDEQDEEPYQLTEEEVRCLPKDMVLVSSKMTCSTINIGTKFGDCAKWFIVAHQVPHLLLRPFANLSGMQPSSKRQNDIIQLTVKRAANQTQFEVLLKLKQADNRDFAFLSPGNDLHPYYSWLKGRGGAITGTRERSASEPSSSSSERKGGLGGLLAGYGSSSSSCSSDEESAAGGLPKQKSGTQGIAGRQTRKATEESAGAQGSF